MKNNLISTLIILMFLTTVRAYTIQYNVVNSISGLPIVGANVSLENITTGYGTLILSNLTDSGGDSFLSSGTISFFTVQVTKSGYSSYDSTLNAVNDSYHAIQLIPLSTEGIIKLRVNDLTLSKHTFCLYWQDPPRLYKCTYANDTYVTINNNVNYTLVTDVTSTDLITSPSKMANNLYIITPILLGGFVILAIIVIALGIIVFIYRKMKGGKK